MLSRRLVLRLALNRQTEGQVEHLQVGSMNRTEEPNLAVFKDAGAFWPQAYGTIC